MQRFTHEQRAVLHHAWDIHIHCAPDAVPRACDGFDLMMEADEADMAAVLLKDHCGSTTGMAAMLRRAFPNGPKCFASFTMNPSNGGLNPYAVEAALKGSARVVWFPTYGAKHQIEFGAMPFPRDPNDPGLTIYDEQKRIRPVVHDIISLIREHDAVLATGHLAPEESLELLRTAKAAGVERLSFTHPTEPVTRSTVDQQKAAVEIGAKLEHCFLALTPSCPGGPSPEEFAAEITEVGFAHCILSSDYGQVANGSPTAGFANWLLKLREIGLSQEAIERMTHNNPQQLLEG